MTYFQKNQWVMSEFDNLDFGDERLKNRMLQTICFMFNNPGKSLYKASKFLSQVKGAYRMFGNDKVTSSEIFSVHQEMTVNRIYKMKTPVVLAIQDTTFLNFNEHLTTKGLGHIGSTSSKHNQGLVMHTTLAYDPSDKVVLGMVDQNIWSRDKKPSPKTAHVRRQIPIGDKESMKWINSLRSTKQALADVGKKVVTVADRECDIFEFMREANKIGEHFVIRATRNRKIISVEKEITFIWSDIQSQPVVGRLDVEIPARSGKKKRMARLDIKFSKFLIKPQQQNPHIRHHDPIETYVVSATESRPPKGQQVLEWVLLTNDPVENLQQALEKINWYKCRWQIEVFHKVLKTVNKVEYCNLRSADQLRKYLTISSITACKIQTMLQESRVNPDKSCTELLDEHEWKVLQVISGKRLTKNSKPPTLREVTRWIAHLGGFKGRKSDGDPGVISLSDGWAKFKNGLLFYQAALK